MRNWKTTGAGIAAAIAAICQCYAAWANNQPIPYDTALPTVIAAIGLLFAKDHNVSGPGTGPVQ